jgi:hypothetical protein
MDKLVLGVAALGFQRVPRRPRWCTPVTATHLMATATEGMATATQLRLRSTITQLQHMATER